MGAITINDIAIGDNITCTLYGAVNGSINVSGQVVSKVSALGLPTTSTAPTDHTNIYRDLPELIKAGITDDYTSYNYFGIKLVDGKIIHIGIPWVIEGSLTRETILTAVIMLTEFRDADVEPVRTLLQANGYKVDSIILQ